MSGCIQSSLTRVSLTTSMTKINDMRVLTLRLNLISKYWNRTVKIERLRVLQVHIASNLCFLLSRVYLAKEMYLVNGIKSHLDEDRSIDNGHYQPRKQDGDNGDPVLGPKIVYLRWCSKNRYTRYETTITFTKHVNYSCNHSDSYSDGRKRVIIQHIPWFAAQSGIHWFPG